MKEQLQDISNRVKAGKAVTPEEFAFLLTNDKPAFFAFMIKNNPGSMNKVLMNKLGYTHELSYTPDIKKISRICDIILKENKQNEIATILENFQFDISTMSPRLIAAIQDIH